MDQAAVLNGILDQLDLWGQGFLVPGGQVDHNMAVHIDQVLVSNRQLVHKLLVPACTGHAVQAAKPGQDRLHFP